MIGNAAILIQKVAQIDLTFVIQIFHGIAAGTEELPPH